MGQYLIEVSPPTRGWTVCGRTGAAHHDGFPAHAGMDLYTGASASAPFWFPRPRGDGPSVGGIGRNALGVSPPTRGWTSVEVAALPAELGFPAHAGMDPQYIRREPVILRFPRPRGDGPPMIVARDARIEVSPPTRGWTRSSRPTGLAVGGFPAHAGMDPRPRHKSSRRPWFPRPRGDGPARRRRPAGAARVSPPTRGWTPLDLAAAFGAVGFPAHAGMDPACMSSCTVADRFPRPRGDGPSTSTNVPSSGGVSPPTRGWTVFLVLHLHDVGGFPAHAGMDPFLALGRLTTRWFPRPRGDGPRARPQRLRSSKVSPPTRGWTSCGAPGQEIDHGFPAHAGMDLRDWRCSPRGIGFPRPRGDGPHTE